MSKIARKGYVVLTGLGFVSIGVGSGMLWGFWAATLTGGIAILTVAILESLSAAVFKRERD